MTRSSDPVAGAVAQREATEGRVPDFFIVGHQKCGTTALYEMLRRHPQIYMPDVKEPRFFASDLYARTQRRAGPPDTLEGYLALFAPATAEQRAGEATPLYLASHEAAARIAEVQPAARIIAILREPASFLRSLHLQFVEARIETKNDLREAIALEDSRRRGKSLPRTSLLQPQGLLYADYVRYVEQLGRFHSVFPRERVMVLIYDDFRADNDATLRQVLRFLEVDDTTPLEAIEANPTIRLRSQPLDDLMHAVSVGRGPFSKSTKAAIKALTPRRVRLEALALTRRRLLHTSPRAPDERLMLELRTRFKGEVVALSEYLDRDLVTLWGYDGIG